ncbi:hypothetical protein [Nocardia sp. NPDC058666]|uniref:hypothetical protein n=1 Tax=Nocardia sp. NPDC058666 TaxID=3346587 RepID=UPI00366483B1
MPPARDEVIGYLQAQGWTAGGQWRSGQIWTRGSFDVLVPGTEVLDYSTAMRALVRCVADAEQRPREAVGRDIAAGGVDVVGYRAGDPADDVPISTATAALVALQDLLVACAEQTAMSEVSGSWRRRAAVTELLDSTALLPQHDVFGYDVYLAGPGSRLGRSVAVRLLDVAVMVRTAAGDEQAARGWQHEVRYETIEAFSALGAAAFAPMSFELNFRWSRQVPRPDVSLDFSRTAVSRLSGLTDPDSPVAEVIAAQPLPEAQRYATVDGVVVGLDNDGGWKVTVRGVLRVGDTSTGRQRRIVVHLRTEHEYAKALVAHRRTDSVRVSGNFDGKRDLEVAENGFTVVGDRT